MTTITNNTTHPSKWLKQKVVTKPKANEGSANLAHLYIANANVKLHVHSGKQFGSFLKKNKHTTTTQPSIIHQ